MDLSGLQKSQKNQLLWIYRAYRKAKKTSLPDIEDISGEIVDHYYKNGGKRNEAKRLLKLRKEKMV